MTTSGSVDRSHSLLEGRIGQTATFSDGEDLPLLYCGANQTSVTAQRRFFTALRLRLGGLLGAMAGAALGGWTAAGINVGGVIALVSFAVALAAELYVAQARPERTWYEGRAAAESAKTLAWRYMVRGESFEDIHDADTDAMFGRELRAILGGLDLALDDDSGGSQITDTMKAVRHADYATRRGLYLKERIEDQRGWYSRKGTWNAKRNHQWLVASIVLEFLGLLGGAIWAFGSVSVDFVGVFAAIAATITAWSQAKQHQTLATAYGITAQELAMVVEEAEAVTEEDWARFVGDAEEAISREHTLWQASRGLRTVPSQQRRSRNSRS